LRDENQIIAQSVTKTEVVLLGCDALVASSVTLGHVNAVVAFNVSLRRVEHGEALRPKLSSEPMKLREVELRNAPHGTG
jgi:hypothetical protein